LASEPPCVSTPPARPGGEVAGGSGGAAQPTLPRSQFTTTNSMVAAAGPIS